VVEGNVDAFEIRAERLGAGELAQRGAAKIDDGEARRRRRKNARHVRAIDVVRVTSDRNLAAPRDELRQKQLL
jgi:hypothetical protein